MIRHYFMNLPFACQVIEAAQQLSQLQLETKDTTEAAAPEPEAQYAIIDTNQLLDHLDAVNSMLEHVDAWLLSSELPFLWLKFDDRGEYFPKDSKDPFRGIVSAFHVDGVSWSFANRLVWTSLSPLSSCMSSTTSQDARIARQRPPGLPEVFWWASYRANDAPQGKNAAASACKKWWMLQVMFR